MVGPELQRVRSEHGLTDFVKSVERAPVVASGDDQRFLHLGERLLDRCNHIALPTSLQVPEVNFPSLREAL